MIRLNKPVQILEWGEGTTTLNQIWTPIGEGKILSAKQKDGATTLVVEVNGFFQKKNTNDDAIKLAQVGEGMTPRSDAWGEVALGKLKDVKSNGGKSQVSIAIDYAAKVGKRG